MRTAASWYQSDAKDYWTRIGAKSRFISSFISLPVPMGLKPDHWILRFNHAIIDTSMFICNLKTNCRTWFLEKKKVQNPVVIRSYKCLIYLKRETTKLNDNNLISVCTSSSWLRVADIRRSSIWIVMESRTPPSIITDCRPSIMSVFSLLS